MTKITKILLLISAVMFSIAIVSFSASTLIKLWFVCND